MNNFTVFIILLVLAKDMPRLGAVFKTKCNMKTFDLLVIFKRPLLLILLSLAYVGKGKKKKKSRLQGILSDQASSFLSHVFFGTESIYFVLSFSSAKETALAISRTTAVTQKIEFANF